MIAYRGNKEMLAVHHKYFAAREHNNHSSDTLGWESSL